ncbi:MAG TPA: tRNA (adenosine(37)-N6)-dimethylallyltransferase MiaA [Oceanipulchritudo sp.]|nr:tRNA (adenosine(37)-N6)-dimethylallyltransferase MiaA [Oceanipulchritudo sp.]
MPKKGPELLFIVGPTASGKTEIALQEAERREALILSCDSLCVYRGMDIGTAKPTEEEQGRIRHYGLDLANPEEPYSVARYIAYRDALLEEHRTNGRPLIVVGGSGFYLKSFFAPVVDRIEIPEAAREAVRRIREAEGRDGLERAFKALHPVEETFPGLDLRNGRRLEKALLRTLASGRSYRELRAAFETAPEPLGEWQKTVWLVSREKEDLQERNRRRVAWMLEEGLVEEVRALQRRGFERNPSACGAIGYREVLAFLKDPVSLEELAEAIYVHTNQLMRKQGSWFRHQIPVDRILGG